MLRTAAGSRVPTDMEITFQATPETSGSGSTQTSRESDLTQPIEHLRPAPTALLVVGAGGPAMAGPAVSCAASAKMASRSTCRKNGAGYPDGLIARPCASASASGQSCPRPMRVQEVGTSAEVVVRRPEVGRVMRCELCPRGACLPARHRRVRRRRTVANVHEERRGLVFRLFSRCDTFSLKRGCPRAYRTRHQFKADSGSPPSSGRLSLWGDHSGHRAVSCTIDTRALVQDRGTATLSR
jgi:hypothetical protein